MRFELVTPAASLASFEAAAVRLPGTEGEFGVLPGHQPLLSTLRPGLLSVVDVEGNKKLYAIGYGCVDVSPEGVTVMAEEAIAREKINREKLQTRLVEISKQKAEAKEASLLAVLQKEQEVLEMQLLVAESA